MPFFEAGITFPGVPDKARLRAPAGAHVWVAVVMYRLSTESAEAAMTATAQVHLDMENLALINVGCYLCEQPWSAQTARRRCSGEPR
jgi:hypothetical protein